MTLCALTYQITSTTKLAVTGVRLKTGTFTNEGKHWPRT